MLDKVIEIANEASAAIMEVYASVDPEVQYKKDDSPVTKADIISDRIITEGLEKLSDIPVVSEEKNVPYDERKNWDKFWLIDPLDGTKDFIVKNNQFTVNIALIENRVPVMGVITIPAEGLCYWAEKGKGSFKDGKKIFNNSARTDLIGSDSNFHSTQETKDFYEKHNITQIKRYGSALKLCKLAEGEIDVYARLNGTMEWDTAAGQIIMAEAGCKIVDVVTKEAIIYNRENQVNNHFIACRQNLNLV